MYVKVKWTQKSDLEFFATRIKEFINLIPKAAEKSPYDDGLSIGFASGLLRTYGCSKGNWSFFLYAPEEEATFEFCGRRHALNNPGNNAGLVFATVFNGNEEILNNGNIITYRTHAPQSKWWECGVEATIPVDEHI